ncbi:leucine-rich repeat protein 1-like [Prosopis cineraria]|uniref:leucine-rich repeat protein 1-like n=1 Tax=Prosopis cineraria TaxID=364024 RepID=UPI002410225D|nr:leucine-rich repeat protein 1-like [Prosopis cineraria]
MGGDSLQRTWKYYSDLETSIPPQQPRLVDLNFTAFPNLERLGLYGMGLVGSIPTQIETLRNLTHLYFFDNNLTGTIPTQIGSLGSLIHLNLSYNKLTGESQAFPSTPIKLQSSGIDGFEWKQGFG